jgi:hypothetical protein
MKKVLAVILILAFASTAMAAGITKYENKAKDAGSTVMYGTSDDGDNIVRIRTTADGGLMPAPSGEVVSSDTSIHLSAAGLSHTTTVGEDWKLSWVTLKGSAALTDTVTVAIESGSGDSYNTVLVSEALVAQTSFYWGPDGGLILKDGDEIKITTTNATTTVSVSATIRGEK